MNESSSACKSDSILESTSSSDVGDLVQAFDLAVQTAVIRCQEALTRALVVGDEETAVHECIRLHTMQMIWELFAQCQTDIRLSQENFFFDRYAV